MAEAFPRPPVPVVLNADSGTSKSFNPDTLQQLIHDTAKEGGREVEVYLVKAGEVQKLLETLIAQRPPEIWVGGGDGSILAAAKLLLETNIVLGVLPFGTFNLLARDLGIPLDAVAAVKALTNAPTERIDVAEASGQPFLCAAQFGFFPDQSRKMEEFHGHWLKKFFLGARDLAGVYFTYPELELRLEQKLDRTRKIKTRSLTVSNNVYAESIGLVPARESLREGSLGVYVSRHQSWLSMIKGLLFLILGRRYQDKDMIFFEFSEFTLATRKSLRIPATLDGENAALETPITFRIKPKALTVRKVSLPVTA